MYKYGIYSYAKALYPGSAYHLQQQRLEGFHVFSRPLLPVRARLVRVRGGGREDKGEGLPVEHLLLGDSQGGDPLGQSTVLVCRHLYGVYPNSTGSDLLALGQLLPYATD